MLYFLLITNSTPSLPLLTTTPFFFPTTYTPPLLSMASILSSQGFLATAMAAVSGTVILLALRLQKSSLSPPIPRSCILSDEKRVSENKQKTKKKVHFAEDVVDPTGYSDEFKRQHGIVLSCRSSSSSNKQQKSKAAATSMPANRMALYNGILRDRVGNRLPYSC